MLLLIAGAQADLLHTDLASDLTTDLTSLGTVENRSFALAGLGLAGAAHLWDNDVDGELTGSFFAGSARVTDVHDALDGCDYHIHKPEGALFLWLWFPDLPITCEELYRRLKARDVLVISGQHFFPGLEDDWKHRHECIRVTYSQDSENVRNGIKIIGEEVRRAFA